MLVGAPDVGISLEAIEELRKRTTAGAATFLVTTKVKAHRGEPANEEPQNQKKPTSKQTRLFQAEMFPRNGMTGRIEQFSHGKSLAGKEVR